MMAGLPEGDVKLFKTQSRGIVFGTSAGLYRYNDRTGRFEPTNWLGGEDFLKRKIHYLYEDGKGNVLVSVGDKIAYGLNQGAKGYTWRITDFNRLSDVLIHYVYPSNKDGKWIGAESGLIHFDPSRNRTPPPFPTLIRKVTVNSGSFDGVLSGGLFVDAKGAPMVDQDSTAKETADDLENIRSINFYLSAPFYDGRPTDTRYLYRLIREGDSDSKEPFKVAKEAMVTFQESDLGFHSYVLQVKAVNIFNQEGVLASYAFANHAPWYRQTQWQILMGLATFLFLAGIIYVSVRYYNKRLERENARLQALVDEKTKKVKDLLHNILPVKIANELEKTNTAKPEEYKFVTLLFTDFKGFTNVAEKCTAVELVDELNLCVTKFDNIMDANRMEKIKTIGDAYMACGGIPEANYTNPIDTVLAGLAIQRVMTELKVHKGDDYWELRVGIHTGGPIVAGVVGFRKWAYDVWGDTVNTAARMESSGEPRKVNISGDTYDLVKDFFVCEYRGELPAKNKGNIKMYFVEHIHPDLSVNGAGIEPNAQFLALKEKFAAQLEKQFNRI
jgi:class 3 adenylate cyclase